jgi:hypothetical protein
MDERKKHAKKQARQRLLRDLMRAMQLAQNGMVKDA